MNYLDVLSENVYFTDSGVNPVLDSLTGVLNRDSLIEYVDYLVTNNIPFAFSITDIDNFKHVNDTYGHLTGDKVLQRVAEECVKEVDGLATIGRYGGDEFLAVFEGRRDYDQIWNDVRTLNHALEGKNFEEVSNSRITITTGLARFPDDAKSRESIMDLADKALYRGKSKGRNCFIIYVHEKHKDILTKDRNTVKMSSTYLTLQAFDILTKDNDYKRIVNEIVSYLQSQLTLDHVCIQSKDKMISSSVSELSRNKNFEVINQAALKEQLNASGLILNNGVLNYSTIASRLSKINSKQQVISQMVYRIKHQGVIYGYIRLENTSANRVWQNDEISLVITVARVIAIMLHNAGKTLEDLVEE